MKFALALFLCAVAPLMSSEPLNVTAGASVFPAAPIAKAAAGTVTAPLVFGGLGDQVTEQPWAGKVVLFDRGKITFAEKVLKAQAAQAVGVIVANNVPDPTGPVTLDPSSSTIPAVYITQADGAALKLLAGSSVRIGPPAPPVVLPSPAGHKGEYLASDGEKWIFVKPVPAIVTGESVALGGAVSYSVTADGTLPLSYQWTKDGTAIPGATAAVFTIPAAQAADAGIYTCVVTNAAGSATSNTVLLAVK